MIGKTISHYRVIEKIGAGGMGEVYSAEDTKLKRIIAIKFLSSNLLNSEAEKARFIREAQSAAALNHPNISHIYSIEEVESQYFIVMEYIDGKTLQELIEENGGSPLPIEKAINYTIKIADGINCAHEKDIIHRDIKSANIMVTEKNEVKIMDFGLAKLINRSMLTQPGTALGTFAYMSPEQAQGEKVDKRSDIWSLGVVLYEMISGQLPFKGEYDQAVVYSIVNEEPEPVTGLRSGVPMELERIQNKAMAKFPDERYQNINEMMIDLKILKKRYLSSSEKYQSTSQISPQHKKLQYQDMLPWFITFLAIGLAIVFGILWQTGSFTENQVMRSSIVIKKD
jgi:serine/threonine protein kinase